MLHITVHSWMNIKSILYLQPLMQWSNVPSTSASMVANFLWTREVSIFAMWFSVWICSDTTLNCYNTVVASLILTCSSTYPQHICSTVLTHTVYLPGLATYTPLIQICSYCCETDLLQLQYWFRTANISVSDLFAKWNCIRHEYFWLCIYNAN